MTTTYDPFAELDRVATSMFQHRAAPRVMPVDLYRDNNRYVLNADLPGIDPGTIDIDVDGQLLTIRAQRTENSDNSVKWLSRERTSGSYLRQFSIGEGVDTGSISASYDNGVLSVIIPMSERAKPRKIEVETAPSASQQTITA